MDFGWSSRLEATPFDYKTETVLSIRESKYLLIARIGSILLAGAYSSNQGSSIPARVWKVDHVR